MAYQNLSGRSLSRQRSGEIAGVALIAIVYRFLMPWSFNKDELFEDLPERIMQNFFLIIDLNFSEYDAINMGYWELLFF